MKASDVKRIMEEKYGLSQVDFTEDNGECTMCVNGFMYITCDTWSEVIKEFKEML